MPEENKDGQEKTEQPTPKRLDDAKKKGQIARSKELNTMAITLIGGIAMVSMSNHFGSGLWDLMTNNFTIPRQDMYDPTAMVTRLAQAVEDGLFMLFPFFLVVVVLAVLSSVALGGVAISGESMTPKLSKLNPLKGLKRVFSLKGLLELLKALAKFLLVGSATGLMLWTSLGNFLGLSQMELGKAVSEMGSIIGGSFVLIASTLIVIAMIDVPFQLWEHKRQLKMTRQEVREEMKDTEGRPEVKGRIRNLQREIAQRRMMEEIPKADVIVTNPTHYAIALRYDQENMLAPEVVAKGSGEVAANIRRVGLEHQVSMVESPMLARAIYFNTELGEAIPAGLYLAVAKLLAYVFQLRIYRTDGGLRPEMPTDLSIPDEYQVAEQ
ncbi:MAG: flagellar type III secretion system protein FlhB [Gammaproteobacteria bacterium]|nr:flagellar type III secretion system protein FlhB [Gammaproteobacteria bacterium]